MDAKYLKDHFGDKLSFHGGIDEQELLPFGSREDVEKEVLRVINILGRNGGYIVAPSHALQSDTPVENALAIFKTAREYRY
ncbi:MAG: uroporphyrinogen decarboxylase family protein [Actinomycetia bacterium]|nr:uroporphyrinogen decarboxylase family protein [Actinomycetes bacterium]